MSYISLIDWWVMSCVHQLYNHHAKWRSWEKSFITRFVPLYLPVSGLRLGNTGFGAKSWFTLFVTPPLAFERFGFSGFLDGFGLFTSYWAEKLLWEFEQVLQIGNPFYWLISFKDENLFFFFNSFPHLCRRRYQAKVSCLSQLIYWMSNYNVPPFNIQPIFNSGS